MNTIILLVFLSFNKKKELISYLRKDKNLNFIDMISTRKINDGELYDYKVCSNEDFIKADFSFAHLLHGEYYGLNITPDKNIYCKSIVVSEFVSEEAEAFNKVKSDILDEIILVGINICDDISDFQSNTTLKNKIRKYRDHLDITLSGNYEDIKSAIHVLQYLLTNRGILDKHAIYNLTKCNTLLHNVENNNIHSASYDLRLSDCAWSQGKYITLNDNNPTLTIPKYSYVLVKAIEEADFPKFLAARFDLKVSLFFKGIILSNAPQVDPGYRGGSLFCLLFNATDDDQGLTRGNHFATIEFNMTARVTEGYKQQYQGKKNLSDFIPESSAVSKGGQLFERLQSIEDKIEQLEHLPESVYKICIVAGGIILAGVYFLLMYFKK